jgi:hypothetical protein
MTWRVRTTGTLEETHWKVLPHPAYSSDLPASDFHVFGTLKEALEEESFRADDEVRFLCKDGWMSKHKLLLKGHN